MYLIKCKQAPPRFIVKPLATRHRLQAEALNGSIGNAHIHGRCAVLCQHCRVLSTEGRLLSVAWVWRQPNPQNTDNWHIRHLPPKLLAHAEKCTQLEAPALCSWGQNHRTMDKELSSFVHKMPQLEVPCSDCGNPQTFTGSYLNTSLGWKALLPFSGWQTDFEQLKGWKVVCAVSTVRSGPTQEAHVLLCSVFSTHSPYSSLRGSAQNSRKLGFIQLFTFWYQKNISSI